MAILIEWPLLALIPLPVLLALFIWSRRRLPLIAALLWTLYLPYELAMKHRILCGGECNIRVDLLVLYPLLIVMSVLAVVSALRAGLRGVRAGI
jgi:hypothetical protein